MERLHPGERGLDGSHPVAALAARQQGVASRAQLLALGLGRNTVDRWVRSGRLHRVHRGVYAVGHPALSREGRWMAAVLAVGPGAVLSHRSAANLWGLTARTRSLVDVTTTGATRRLQGIAVHRTRRLEARDVARHCGIPVTTVARTLVDLADHASTNEVRRALHHAEITHFLTSRELSATTIHGRRGTKRLKRATTEGPDRSRSDLERAFLRLCERHAIPRPEHNVLVAGVEVDFLWRAEGVVAEVDGWRYHRTRQAFEQDRARDALLAREGLRVVRFADRQVAREPGRVAATVLAALASRG